MRVIIVGGGEKPFKELILKYLIEDTKIIAADGGANCLVEYGITPNYIIGDLDSIHNDTIKNLEKCEFIKYPTDKDYTDTELAYNKAVEIGAEEIVFLGCTGMRQDHFFANMCVLYKGLKLGIKTSIVDQYNEIFLVDKDTVIEGYKGQVFSVFSYFEAVKGLTIRGARFELEDFQLELTNNLTVSNEFFKDKVYLKLKNGVLVVIINHN